MCEQSICEQFVNSQKLLGLLNTSVTQWFSTPPLLLLPRPKTVISVQNNQTTQAALPCSFQNAFGTICQCQYSSESAFHSHELEKQYKH